MNTQDLRKGGRHPCGDHHNDYSNHHFHNLSVYHFIDNGVGGLLVGGVERGGK